MAGHMINQYLREQGLYEVIGLARSEGVNVDAVIDASDDIQLKQYLNQVKPDIVINCIGILVEQSDRDIICAIEMNSLLPHKLVKWGREYDFKLIHISTDCVFSGKEGGYLENSFRDGDDNYSRTKALGEIINDKDLTIRTSIIETDTLK